MLVPDSGLVETILKAAEEDPDGTAEFVRLGLYEALCDLVDGNQRYLQRRLHADITKRSAAARRVLVRNAVENRLAGDDISEIGKAAASLTLVDSYIAKDEGDGYTPDDPKTKYWDARQAGRFAPRRGKVTTGTYDVLGALTESDPHLRTRAEEAGKPFEEGGDRYDRMRSVGNALVLAGTHTNQPAVQAAGSLARISAEVGPEAERVLSPGFRRTAYRYRGTERRPDRQLVIDTKGALARVSAAEETDQFGVPTPGAETQHKALKSSFAQGPSGRINGVTGYHYSTPGASDLNADQKRMRVAGDIATDHLIDQIPSMDEARISWAAGKTPPSMGVMIDRDGDVVSEAMGYNGDHYLPFDLKNLKRLHGGQYARTRTLGGPTEEDIYTGLLTGARQVQVASNSGVFTVEFDPDLRGGRRYSDKARQMVARYGKIVNAIDSKEIYAHDVSDMEKKRLFNEALKDNDYDQELAEQDYKRKLKRARGAGSAGMSPDEMLDEATRRAEEWGHARRATPAQIDARTREEMTELRTNIEETGGPAQVRQLKLNGEGYYRALKSLQREFPYYIRDVQFEPLPDFIKKRKLHVEGSGQLPKRGAPALQASNRVKLGDVLEGNQASSRGLSNRGVRNRLGGGKPAEAGTAGTDSTESEEGTAAVGGGGPKPGSGSGGGGVAALLESREFASQFARNIDVIHATDRLDLPRIVPDVTTDGKELPVDREQAKRDSDPPIKYVTWLASEGNPYTHGTTTGIAGFLRKEASDSELDVATRGLEALRERIGNFNSDYTAEHVDAALKWVNLVRNARDPFGTATGDLHEYEPDIDSPKPYPVKEIVRAMGDIEGLEAYDRAQKLDSRTADQWSSARDWVAQQRDDRAIGQGIYKDIDRLHDDDFETDVARQRTVHQIEARQKAWAWTKAMSVTKELEEVVPSKRPKAAPAQEAGEPQAVATRKNDGRCLLVPPDSPIAKALQEGLRSGRLSLPSRRARR